MFKKLGLIKGRHELPVEEYILEEAVTEYTQKALIPVIDSRLDKLGFELQHSEPYDLHHGINTWTEEAPKVRLYLTGLTIVSLLAVRRLNQLGYDVETHDYNPHSKDYYLSGYFPRLEYDLGGVGVKITLPEVELYDLMKAYEKNLVFIDGVELPEMSLPPFPGPEECELEEVEAYFRGKMIDFVMEHVHSKIFRVKQSLTNPRFRGMVRDYYECQNCGWRYVMGGTNYPDGTEGHCDICGASHSEPSEA